MAASCVAAATAMAMKKPMDKPKKRSEIKLTATNANKTPKKNCDTYTKYLFVLNISKRGAHKNFNAQGSMITEVQNVISVSVISKESYMAATVPDKAIKGIPLAIQELAIQPNGDDCLVVISDTLLN